MQGSAPLRVLHVVRQFHPSIGGIEDVVLNLVRGQRESFGLDARVLTLDRIFTDPGIKMPREEVVAGIPVIRIPWRGSSRYPLAPSALRNLGDADIVHTHAIDFFFDYLAFTKPLHRRRLVASTHGGFFHTPYGQRLKRIWFATVTRAAVHAHDAIVAVSEGDAALFAKVAGRRLVTIENGVNLGKFPERPDIARDPRRILVFGRFARHKHVERMVALLAELRRHELGWTLVISGPAGDHPVEEIRASAATAGVADAVHVRVAPSDADLATEVARATWYGSASSHEGFGVAAVEAASAGLMPVLSDIPPFAQLCARIDTGVLFDPAAPQAAAVKMIALATRMATEGPALRRKIANGVSGYGWAAATAAHVHLYRSVMTPEAATRDKVGQWA